ncbi:MAG: hypothetical protein UZ21_OP11001000578 [Microgenomates bacterium OLB22]|nr:MAG: hypothetical protein UZ21_OP11001000578 [Microgenomates bacterium OLB22]
MLHLLVLAVILLATFLFGTTPILLMQDTYYYPWLTTQGLVPYKDFFDHHGPLLYYLFAPFTKDLTLSSMHMAYFVVKGIILFLLTIVFARNLNRLSVFWGLLYGTLFLYAVSPNSLWYEHFITLFIVLAYMVHTTGAIGQKQELAGFLVGLATLCKPTALIFIIPFLIAYRSWRPLMVVGLVWLPILIYFLYKGALLTLIDSLFLFNLSYARFVSTGPAIDGYLWQVVMWLLIICSTMLVLRAQLKGHRLLYGLIFCSFIFVYPRFVLYNMVPLVTFVSILVGVVFYEIYRTYIVFIASILLFFPLFSLAQNVKHQYVLNHSLVPYHERESSREIIELMSSVEFKGKQIYLFSNDLEIYYLLRQKPPTYTPSKFEWITDYYKPDVKSELQKNKVPIVLIPTKRSGLACIQEC